MRQPQRYTAYNLQGWDTEREGSDGRWRPARPYALMYGMFKERIKLTWFVLIGKYDALDWEEDK